MGDALGRRGVKFSVSDVTMMSRMRAGGRWVALARKARPAWRCGQPCRAPRVAWIGGPRSAIKILAETPFWRWIIVVALLVPIAGASTGVHADEPGLKALIAGGHVAMIRHALTTPGTGDPRNFRLDDCATQRNLVEEGREEARMLGRLLREHGVRVDAVLSSQWCRCTETARLLGVGDVRTHEALNNLFGRPQNREPQVRALRAMISSWKGPGALVLVTHGATIGAFTQMHPGTAEGVVLAPAPETNEGFRVVGKIGPRG